MKRVLLIGDSIRMSYQLEVCTALAGTTKVFAPVENCRHSTNVRECIAEWMNDFRPDIVHINAGLHDLIRNRETRGYQFPVDVYARNIEAAVDVMRDAKVSVLWALTSPVNDAWNLKTHGYQMRSDADVKLYNDAASDVMKRLGVPVNDVYAVVLREGMEKMHTPDGVHFNEAGQKILGAAVSQKIKSVFG